MRTDNNSKKGEEWRQQSFAVLEFSKHLHLTFSWDKFTPNFHFIPKKSPCQEVMNTNQTLQCLWGGREGDAVHCRGCGTQGMQQKSPEYNFITEKAAGRCPERNKWVFCLCQSQSLILKRETEREVSNRTGSLCAGTFFANLIRIIVFIYQNCYQPSLTQKDGEEKVTLGGRS